MRSRRTGHPILLAIVGLLVGLGLGLGYGWGINPIEYTDTEISALHPGYRDDFVLMVGQAYASDHDLDLAWARIKLLDEPAPTTLVADLAETAITEQRPEDQIRVLALLARDMGAKRESLAPYLSSLESAR